MDSWTIVEAKARFSELVDRVKDSGPQTITKNGRPAAVIVSTEEWLRKTQRKGTLVEFFAKSPLTGSGVKIERLKDGPRAVDL